MTRRNIGNLGMRATIGVILTAAATHGTALGATTTITDASQLTLPYVNNGLLYLGGNETTKTGGALSLTFGTGDDVTTTTALADRSEGSIRIYDANVTLNGGNVSNRWFRLHNGRWTNLAGDTFFDIQNIIGCGEIADDRAVKASTFDVQGGSYTFRRLAVGMANSDAYPARLTLSGGVAGSDVMNPVTSGNTKWYSGLDIAVRALNGETPANSGTQFDTEYASGDVLISGNGKLSVPRVSFGGNHTTGPWGSSGHASGRLRMTGGEIEIGTVGFCLGENWNAAANSWYDVTLSGGKVSTRYGGARQDMAVRLSSANGGVTYDIGSGHTYTVGTNMFGSGGLVKTGAGTMALGCGNDYTGRTEIAQGRLVVKSTAAASGTAYLASDATVPPATTSLLADDLSAANGASVSSWTAHTGSSPATELTLTTAQTFMSEATAPVVTTAGFNGHKAVSFNGMSSMLGCGGAGAAYLPIGSGNGTTSGFSVAMVVRFNAPGGGSSKWSFFSSNPFFGPTRNGYGQAYTWNIALTGAGQLQGGSVWTPQNNDNKADWADAVTARPMPRWLDDGRPHVVVMTFPDIGESAGKVTMTVDGYRSESAASWLKSTSLGYSRSYMLLGGSNMCATNRYTACDVAEIRFWRGTQLSEAQIKAFCEEASTTYGVELDGYMTFGVSGQHSKEVHVAFGASYGTDEIDWTLPLYAGQTLSGAGAVIGKMSAQTGSSIVLSASGSPAFDNLTLVDGATIKIADDAAAALTATMFTIGENDVVDVDVSAIVESNRSVNLVSFASGTATAANFRVVPATAEYSVKVANGKVRLSCMNGMQLIYR